LGSSVAVWREDLMEIGMLWFDNDKGTSIPNKVKKAARYYQKKYGVSPDLCYVHPKTAKGANGKKKSSKNGSQLEQLRIGKIRVLKNKKILPDHFWIGVGTKDDPIN
jgi:hypothetical protein